MKILGPILQRRSAQDFIDTTMPKTLDTYLHFWVQVFPDFSAVFVQVFSLQVWHKEHTTHSGRVWGTRLNTTESGKSAENNKGTCRPQRGVRVENYCVGKHCDKTFVFHIKN